MIKLTSILILLIVFLVSNTSAQTTVFTYQGRLTDATMAANADYDFEFALYDSLTGGNQIAVLNRNNVTVSNGVFTVTLDFTAAGFPGADRFLRIGVKRSSEPDANPYALLTPRQPVMSTPYAIRSLSAAAADNAQALGGTAANQFVLTGDSRLTDSRAPTAGSANYIQNTLTAQSANFSITGSGEIADRLTAGGVTISAPANGKAVDIASGRIVLSYATVTGGTTEADGGAIPNTAAVIEISDNGSSGAGATATLPATAANGTIIVVGTADADGAVVFGVSGGASFAFNANQSARFTRIAGAWKFLGQ